MRLDNENERIIKKVHVDYITLSISPRNLEQISGLQPTMSAISIGLDNDIILLDHRFPTDLN